MFQREMKVNLKNFLVWLFLLIGIFSVVFLIYPSIVSSDNIKSMDEMLKMFPKDLLKAFNMDLSSISSAYGWLKSEGFVFLLLITGCYSAMLGSNLLLKEENDKTIEYLNSLPVKRTSIVLQKVLAGVVYITLLVGFIGFFNWIGLSMSGEFHQKEYLLLSITPLFSSISIFFFCLFLSTFTHKTKKMVGLSLGVVFVSYIFQMLSSLSDSVSFLKYFSLFTLTDTRNVLLKVAINPLMVLLTIVISLFFFIGTMIRYHQKELVS